MRLAVQWRVRIIAELYSSVRFVLTRFKYTATITMFYVQVIQGGPKVLPVEE